MSRFFKSAAFPILIVVVLAFFAQKLIGSSNHGPNYSFGNLLSQLDTHQVKNLSLDQKSNSASLVDVTGLLNDARDAKSPVKTNSPGSGENCW